MKLLCFEERKGQAVSRLLRGVPQWGGTASRKTLEGLIETAFDGGVLAALQECMEAVRYDEEAYAKIAKLLR